MNSNGAIYNLVKYLKVINLVILSICRQIYFRRWQVSHTTSALKLILFIFFRDWTATVEKSEKRKAILDKI